MAKDWVSLETLFPTKRQAPPGVTAIAAPKNGYFNKVKSDKNITSTDMLTF